jgi:Calcium-dependent channel, 7TM region, putative phosphate/Late exocytosis, associated with Golgi transport/Cytosolic domain of 10TM putative phosphate transporter
MWQLNSVTEDEMMMECGMDSVCVLRLLFMGYRICLLSVFNAIWLMPLYATASSNSTDPVVSVTVANVPDRSDRLIGTVLATYLLFGYVMYLILQEFEWFIEMRHKYLKRPVVENYSVYVRNIPPEYCTNSKLYSYFADCFTQKNVLEAKVRIKLPSLVKAVRKRDLLVKKLGHAVNYQLVKGQMPMHTEIQLLRREKVESIPFYATALREANIEVSTFIERVESEIMNCSEEDPNLSAKFDTSTTIPSDVLQDSSNPPSTRFSTSSTRDDSTTVSLQSGKTPSSSRIITFLKVDDDVLLSDRSNYMAIGESEALQCSENNAVNQNRLLPTRALMAASHTAAASALSFGKTASKSASKMLSMREEGEYYNAGFVTFSCLGTTQAALQMVHHEVPFDIEVFEAPRPDDIFWSNVGRSHHDLQVGKLISLGSTIALCLLWTIPMTFIASLSTVEALSAQIPPLGDLIDKYPFIGKLCEVLAPLLVKVVNGLLPTILEYLTKFEGPVSGSIIVASLFTKLAAFMIIQTFFVSAVGSSILPRKSVSRCVCSVPLLTTQVFHFDPKYIDRD